MRFHRNIKMLRGQLDAAPFVMVFFLVLIFVMLGSLTYTPGVHVALPAASGFAGTSNRTVQVTVDPQDRLYFQNRLLVESELSKELRALRKGTQEPLTLIISADRDVTYDTLVRVAELARDAGIEEALLATMPRLFPSREPRPALNDDDSQ